MALENKKITILNEKQPHLLSDFENPVLSWATSTFVDLKSERCVSPRPCVYREDHQARELASAFKGIFPMHASSPPEPALLLSRGPALDDQNFSGMSTIDLPCSTFQRQLKNCANEVIRPLNLANRADGLYSLQRNEVMDFADDALLPRRELVMDWAHGSTDGLLSSTMNCMSTQEQDCLAQTPFQMQHDLFYIAGSSSFTEVDSALVDPQIQQRDPYTPEFEDSFSALGSAESDWAPGSIDVACLSNSSEDSTSRFIVDDVVCRKDVSEPGLTSNRMAFIPSATETGTNDSPSDFHATKNVLGSTGFSKVRDCHRTKPDRHNTGMEHTECTGAEEQPVLVPEQMPDFGFSDHEEVTLHKAAMEGHDGNTIAAGRMDQPASVLYVTNSAFVPTVASSALFAPPRLFPDASNASNSKVGSVKEMIYRAAALQPVNFSTEAIRRPKRRNVRISKDPQSVAARHRRERISDRIRILQSLVPGGMKMDTASMLDEAIHYIKFLKTELHALENLSNSLNRTSTNWAIQANGHPKPAPLTSIGPPNLCRASNLSQASPLHQPGEGDVVSAVHSTASFGQSFSARLKQQSCH